MNQSNQFTATKDNAKREIPEYADTRQHLNNSNLSPTGAFPQSFTHNPNKRKRKGVATSLSASSWQARSFGLDCGYGLIALVPARPRSSSTIAGKYAQLASRRRCPDEGERRGPTARARTLRQGKERTGREWKMSFSIHPRAPERRGRRTGPFTCPRESEPPLFIPFITRVCKYLDHRGPVGGATLAHWSGEKEACISLDPDICTRGSALSFTKGLEGARIRRLSPR